MRVIFLIFILAFVSCNSPSNKKKVALEQFQISVDSLFNSKIEANQPGAGLLVAYDGEMLIGKGFGLRDMVNKIPITSSTNMRTGSVTKQFTALAVLNLIEKGMLSLNDSVTKFFPYPVFEHIKIYNLLNHTSGIADYEEYFIAKGDRSKIIENEDVLNWLSTNPEGSFEPGQGWEYSNTGYIVLALLVEKISGQEFSEYTKENVFEKSGMQKTNFFSLAHPIDFEERAFCYAKDSTNHWEKVDGFFMNGLMGDGAIFTSMNDYFQFDNAIRNNSLIKKDLHNFIFEQDQALIPKEDWSNDFFKDYPFSEERIYYNYGWFRNEHTAFHTGGHYGTRTMVVHDLKRPLTIAVFLNSNQAEIRKEVVIGTYNLADEYLKTIGSN